MPASWPGGDKLIRAAYSRGHTAGFEAAVKSMMAARTELGSVAVSASPGSPLNRSLAFVDAAWARVFCV
jgi:hypothetical protein